MSTSDLETTLRQFFNDHRRGSASSIHASDMVPTMAAFGIGILVGAGVALLFAPASGEDLREELSEQIGDLKSRVTGSHESPAVGGADAGGVA
jgi:hypothetical protein